jgi:hypothetical protein
MKLRHKIPPISLSLSLSLNPPNSHLRWTGPPALVPDREASQTLSLPPVVLPGALVFPSSHWGGLLLQLGQVLHAAVHLQRGHGERVQIWATLLILLWNTLWIHGLNIKKGSKLVKTLIITTLSLKPNIEHDSQLHTVDRKIAELINLQQLHLNKDRLESTTLHVIQSRWVLQLIRTTRTQRHTLAHTHGKVS